MAMFILNDATGVGTGTIDSAGVFVDLSIIANDTGLGLGPDVGGQQLVSYARTLGGPPQLRLDELVNTTFQPDYGSGPQTVDIILVSLPDDFVFGDGSFGLVNNGTALPPSDSGLGGADLNPTVNCLVLYDTLLEICVARDGTGGTLDLATPGPVILYHELSHARRVVRNELLALGGGCDPSSPEENAAIIDENDVRVQIAALLSTPPELRDPGIHCGGTCPAGGGSCCIVASLVSGSPTSVQVQGLRQVRDGFLRTTETGFEFFRQLHYDYYAFSPQVCTMLAGSPAAQALVLHGFVEPLMEFWQFMAARAGHRGDLDAAGLSALFDDHVTASVDDPAELVHLRGLWRSGVDSGTPAPGLPAEIPTDLVGLLRYRAWPRESIQWALIHPLRIVDEIVSLAATGADRWAVGRRLEALLDAWTPELPLASVWGTLPAEQLAAELGMCEEGLLQTDVACAAFRRRLAAAFPAATAISDLQVNEARDDTGTNGGVPWR